MAPETSQSVIIHKLSLEGRTYLVSHDDLDAVFERYGRPFACQLAACPHVELIPNGEVNGIPASLSKCVYKPNNSLDWTVLELTKSLEPQPVKRCEIVDKKLITYLQAGHLDEFVQTQ